MSFYAILKIKKIKFLRIQYFAFTRDRQKRKKKNPESKITAKITGYTVNLKKKIYRICLVEAAMQYLEGFK